MEIGFSTIAAIEPSALREVLPAWIAARVDAEPGRVAGLETRIRAELARSSDEELAELIDAFVHAGEGWRYFPAVPLGRRLSRIFMDALVAPSTPDARGLDDAGVLGLDRLRAAARGPVLLLSNHLSYADTQVTDLLLHRHGATDLADRLVAVAGPKVYTDPFRRLAAIGLGTLKTAQSARLDHNDAGLSGREVARIAVQTVRIAHELMGAGHLVLLYGEGSRTRTGRFGSFLKAVGKYAAMPGLTVVPMALAGSDRLFGIGAERLSPARIRLAVGEPFAADDYDRQGVLEQAWHRIAALLPPAYRPAPGTPPLG